MNHLLLGYIISAMAIIVGTFNPIPDKIQGFKVINGQVDLPPYVKCLEAGAPPKQETREVVARERTVAPKANCVYGELIAKYFPQSQWRNACLVMYGESGGNPRALGDTSTLYPSAGLFQIRLLPSRGLSGGQMYDPNENVKYAAHLWSKSGWCPWTYAKKIGLCHR